MNPTEIKKKLQPWIKKERPLLVLLFGSTISKIPGPEPDIDIATLFGRPTDLGKQITNLMEALQSDNVDLMVLDHADPIARMSASNGELIHEDKSGRHARFASLATRQFMDNEKFDRTRRELTDEFLRERGFI